jgi:hypothetical protein
MFAVNNDQSAESLAKKKGSEDPEPTAGDKIFKNYYLLRIDHNKQIDSLQNFSFCAKTDPREVNFAPFIT